MEKPYPPLDDALKYQIGFMMDEVAATMVGLSLPDCMVDANTAR